MKVKNRIQEPGVRSRFPVKLGMTIQKYVIPAFSSVIPAKAGIYRKWANGRRSPIGVGDDINMEGGNDKDGFSLIEQLVALFILLIAVLAIAPFLSSNLNNIKKEDYKVKASNLAQEMIEAAKSTPFSELATGSYSTSGPYPEPDTSTLAILFNDFEDKITDSSYIPSGSGYMIISTADEITTSANMREIIVRVQWLDRGRTQSYELPTYIYRVAE